MPTLALDDVDLQYEVTGDGQPLVFVHGGWMNGDAWRTQVERFAADNRVITVDLRGHGRTGATDTREYSIGLFTDDLEALLAHLDVERPVLCGLSLGGMVVQEYLDRHPDEAAGAIVAGPVRSMPPFEIPSAVKPFVSPLPVLATTLSVAGSAATFQSLLASIRPVNGGPWLSVDPSIHSWARSAVGDVDSSEFRKIFRALYEYEPPTLSHVTTPLLVVYGDTEVSMVKNQGNRLGSAVPDGTVREIPDAGHLVNQDNPEAFNDALAEFMAGLSTDDRRPAA
jgi:non-heme chloroperoxidase